MNIQRSQTALHLSQTPLIYVVTQVRFSPIVFLDKFIPEIQEKMRHKYPWFQHSRVPQMLQTDGGAPPALGIGDRFDFLQRDKKTGVVLTSNTVALQTNKYSSFEAFAEEFASVLSMINESLEIGLVERIGLRYVDLVTPDANESWPDYLQPGVLGLDSSLVGVDQWWNLRFESLGRTSFGTLAIRCTQSQNPLPLDLVPLSLRYDSELLEPQKIRTILDFDHYSEETRDFEVDLIVVAIGGLHENLDGAFRNAVTPKALKRWE